MAVRLIARNALASTHANSFGSTPLACHTAVYESQRPRNSRTVCLPQVQRGHHTSESSAHRTPGVAEAGTRGQHAYLVCASQTSAEGKPDQAQSTLCAQVEPAEKARRRPEQRRIAEAADSMTTSSGAALGWTMPGPM